MQPQYRVYWQKGKGYGSYRQRHFVSVNQAVALLIELRDEPDTTYVGLEVVR